MNKTGILVLAMALLPACAFAVDGVVLINQATVTAAGGFPYAISTSGSYKLSGNLLVPNGVNGIQISVSSVTLDLNGFSITSADTSGSTSLLQIAGAVRSITVRSGVLSCASCTQIDNTQGGTFQSAGTVFEDLTLLQSSGGGGFDFGRSVILRRVSFPGSGVSVSCPALVVDSLAAFFHSITTVSTSCAYGFNSGPVI